MAWAVLAWVCWGWHGAGSSAYASATRSSLPPAFRETAEAVGDNRAPLPLLDHQPTAHVSASGGSLPLSSIAQLRQRKPIATDPYAPIRLRGVVTYHDRLWHAIVVEDETGGIWLDSGGKPVPVEAPGEPPALLFGLAVEVLGELHPGGFSPMVHHPRLRVLGPGVLPEPRRPDYGWMASGKGDCQWVEVEGIVHWVRDGREASPEARGHVSMRVSMPGGTFRVWLPNWERPTVPLELVDSRVRFRGVGGIASNARGQMLGVDLLVPSYEYLQVIEPAPADPFAASLPQPIHRLLRYSPEGWTNHRIKVAGVVLYQEIGRWLYIKDDTQALRVETTQTNTVSPGDRVEVLGFVNLGDSGPVLEGGSFRRLDSGPPPQPLCLTAEQILRGGAEDELVQIEGYLVGHGRHGDKQRLLLRSGGTVFSAELAAKSSPAPVPAEGSRLRLTGISVVELQPFYLWPEKFRLLLRSSTDIQVLRSPSWWTRQRLTRALGLASGIALLGGLWLLLLSRKNTALRQAEAALQRVNDQLEQKVRLRTSELSQANASLRGEIAVRQLVEGQLREAQTLEAVGRLAGGMAHDFNNILCAMLMNLGLAQTQPRLAPEVRDRLAEAQAQARRAAALIRQLLMYGQRHALQRRPLDLRQTIESAAPRLIALVGPQVEVRLPSPNSVRPVDADPLIIEQVLMDLGANARDAMPSGGLLSLHVEDVHFTPKAAALQAERRPGEFVCLRVADTGCGMGEATVAHIFEPFFTTKEVGHGTGLGLASVHGVVKQHRGWIEVESGLNRGTTFRLYFPALAGAAVPPSA